MKLSDKFALKFIQLRFESLDNEINIIFIADMFSD